MFFVFFTYYGIYSLFTYLIDLSFKWLFINWIMHLSFYLFIYLGIKMSLFVHVFIYLHLDLLMIHLFNNYSFT